MKTLVIYTSKTGYTKQYAQMLSESLNCPSLTAKQASKSNLNDYDLVIYGGGIRAGKIAKFSSVVNQLKRLDHKRILVFAVGATGKSDEYTADIRKQNITAHHVDYPFFYFQGGFDPSRLSLLMRFMLKRVEASIIKKAVKDPDSLKQGDQDFLDFFQTPHTNIHIENLSEIISYIEHLPAESTH